MRTWGTFRRFGLTPPVLRYLETPVLTNLGTGVLVVNGIGLQGAFENTVPLAYTDIMQTVVETLTYLKAASTLFTEAERADIVSAIASDPEAGDLMPGTGGYRKRRFGRAGIGKRGGARVVYLYGGENFPIFLITVYAKAEKGNLSKAEQNALAKMAKSFFADYGRNA